MTTVYQIQITDLSDNEIIITPLFRSKEDVESIINLMAGGSDITDTYYKNPCYKIFGDDWFDKYEIEMFNLYKAKDYPAAINKFKEIYAKHLNLDCCKLSESMIIGILYGSINLDYMVGSWISIEIVENFVF